MKFLLFTPLILLSNLLAQDSEPEKPAPTISPEESIRQSSLALGYQEGIRTAQQQMLPEDFNPEAYLEGFLTGLRGEKISLTPEQIREAKARLQETLTAREAETAKANLKASKEFLAANKNQKGVVKLDSSLQYRVVKDGEGEVYGEEGLIGKEIFANYRGTLPDGTVFSASDEFTPSQVHLDEVISGFREALSLMKKGDRWVVFIPSEMAYGDQRRSSAIGPNQLLIFEIELADVREPAPASE